MDQMLPSEVRRSPRPRVRGWFGTGSTLAWSDNSSAFGCCHCSAKCEHQLKVLKPGCSCWAVNTPNLCTSHAPGFTLQGVTFSGLTEKKKQKKKILRLKWKLAIIINLNFNCLYLTWNCGRSCTQHSSPRLHFSEHSFASLMHFKTFWSRTAQGCSVLLCANWFLTPSPPFRGRFKLNWPPSLPSGEWFLNCRQEWAPSLEMF